MPKDRGEVYPEVEKGYTESPGETNRAPERGAYAIRLGVETESKLKTR